MLLSSPPACARMHRHPHVHTPTLTATYTAYTPTHIKQSAKFSSTRTWSFLLLFKSGLPLPTPVFSRSWELLLSPLVDCLSLDLEPAQLGIGRVFFLFCSLATLSSGETPDS